MAVTGHKMYGPQGAGALYIREGLDIAPLIVGGGQEGGMRGGTENVPGIAGLGKAAELALEGLSDAARIAALRDKLQAELLAALPGAKVNGLQAERLPNTLSIVLPGTRGESLTAALDRRGVSISSGSACHAGSPVPSGVLKAMGLSDEEAFCAVRISLGRPTTADEVARAVRAILDIMREEQAAVSFRPCR